MHSLSEQAVQFGGYLCRLFDAWATTKGDDDVAELTLEWAAARNLQAANEVVLAFQKVVTRSGDGRHVRLVDLFIPLAVFTFLPFR